MINMRSRRMVLRRYAEEALDFFQRAYSSVVFETSFHNRLRDFWRRRAEIFFDYRDPRFPYIRHQYSIDHPTPYTQDTARLFLHRGREPFENRNPPATPTQAVRILSIHSKCGSNSSRYRSHETYSV